MSTTVKTPIILKDGVSFVNWRADLRAELSRADVLGHVFHDIRGIDPEIEPKDPDRTKFKTIEDYDVAMQAYKIRLRAWTKGEIEAHNIIIQRLDDSKKSHFIFECTAKELYDMIASSNEVKDFLPHSEAFEIFISTKFTTTAENYCNNFLQNLHNLNDAADLLSLNNNNAAKFKISDELASVYFMNGTKHVKWLDAWRKTQATNMSQYSPLKHMISTLKVTAGTRNIATENHIESPTDDPPIYYPISMSGPFLGNNPNSRHKKNKNKYKNKEGSKRSSEKMPKNFASEKSEDEGSEKIANKSRNKGHGTILRPITGSIFDSDNDGHIFIF